MPTKDEVAFLLAQSLFIVDPSVIRIFGLTSDQATEDDPKEPIKLLLVNEETLPFGIRPVYFRPHPASGIVYPSSIVEITPDEFDQLTQGNGELKLPEGWRFAGEIAREPVPEESTP